MLNQEAFIKRLHLLFKHYNLTAATFSDEIKVQRSSISHLLSGRNKPSLEFVLKIMEHYEEVTPDWLLHGKGTFPKTKTTPKPLPPKQKSLFGKAEEETKEVEVFQEPNEEKITIPSSEIERIVIFYKNGSFKEYKN